MKILYISHVRWGWIKQRPHFLAEGLARNNSVDYCFYQSKTYDKSKDYTASNIDRNLSLKFKTYYLLPFERIPFIGKWKIFERLNWLFMRWQLPCFKQYDLIWITHPTIYPQIKRAIKKNNRVVYDCMDDMVAFPEVKNKLDKVKFTLKSEKELLESSSVVFCSSDYLKNTILKRANVERDVVVVNNAIELPSKIFVARNNMPDDVKKKYDQLSNLSNIFMYIGTISEWFDFEKVKRLLEDIPSLNIVLVGPAYATTIPEHPRIVATGPIDRNCIFAFMEKTKALIMPFIVNELIESVNPVKLYEYIYSGKPSIASYYSETAKFKDFVYLYRDYEELKNYASGVVDNSLAAHSNQDVDAFIKQNTWAERIKVVEKAL